MFDLRDKSYFRRYSAHALTASAWFAELVGFPKMFANVQFSRKLSKITEDAICAELDGFPKINKLLRQRSIRQISRMTKDMVDNVSFFLEGYPRCSKFSEVRKRSEKDTVSELLSLFPVQQYV